MSAPPLPNREDVFFDSHADLGSSSHESLSAPLKWASSHLNIRMWVSYRTWSIPSPGLPFLFSDIHCMYPLQFVFCSISMWALYLQWSILAQSSLFCCFHASPSPHHLDLILNTVGFFCPNTGFFLIHSDIGPMAS